MNAQSVSSRNAAAAILIIKAVADAIQELGVVPSGELYANLMGRMSIETYERIIRTLKGAQLIEERGNLLCWIGPAKR